MQLQSPFHLGRNRAQRLQGWGNIVSLPYEIDFNAVGQPRRQTWSLAWLEQKMQNITGGGKRKLAIPEVVHCSTSVLPVEPFTTALSLRPRSLPMLADIGKN